MKKSLLFLLGLSLLYFPNKLSESNPFLKRYNQFKVTYTTRELDLGEITLREAYNLGVERGNVVKALKEHYNIMIDVYNHPIIIGNLGRVLTPYDSLKKRLSLLK